MNGIGTALEKGGPDKSLLLPLAETGSTNRSEFGDQGKHTVSSVWRGHVKSEFSPAEGSPCPVLFPQKHEAQKNYFGGSRCRSASTLITAKASSSLSA